MANVRFSFDYGFAATPRTVWDALLDWKGHEHWVPATKVEVHADGDPTAVGAEFTAWTGIALGTAIGRKMSLEDRMVVSHIEFNPRSSTGSCRIDKMGPLLAGHASFTVAPAGHGTTVKWVEEVVLPYAPQFTAPLIEKVTTAGFRFALGRLNKQLPPAKRVAPGTSTNGAST